MATNFSVTFNISDWWLTTQVTRTINTTNISVLPKVVTNHSVGTTWQTILWSCLQWLVFVIGTVGNLLVITVLIWNRSRSQVVTQLFVGSLSIAGLALMLSSAWVQGLVFVTNDFPFGRLSCKIQYFWQAEGIYCHAWNIVTVAADRFLGINKPGKESFVNFKWAVVLVVIIWVSSSAANVPLGIWSDISTNQANGLRTCTIFGVDPTARAIQVTFSRFAFYFIPLIITWICYIGLVIRMKAALTKVVHAAPSSSAPNAANKNPNGQSSSSSSRKVTVMCMAIAVNFTLTSLPLQLNFLVIAYASTPVAAYANTLSNQLRIFTMLTVCTNPFIYGIMWKPFRTALIKMTKDMTKCCRRQETKSSDQGGGVTSNATANEHNRQRRVSMSTVA